MAALSFAVGFMLSYVFFTPVGSNFAKKSGEFFATVKDGLEKNTKGLEIYSLVFGSQDFLLSENQTKKLDSEDTDDGDESKYLDTSDFNPALYEKAIVADLFDMTLSLYQDGQKISEYEILSKGRPGTPWETPAGEYKVLYKEDNHFSSIGSVYMPSSIQFFGNFFIHGWPYYPGGRPVAEGYSGGCIRLGTEDALEVFEFAERDVPILVKSNKEISKKVKTYQIEEEEPKLKADSYLVADLSSGEIIMEKSSGEVRPIASITKLMTSLVSLEVINQYQITRVSNQAVGTEGFAGGLVAGETLETGQLIYPLLLTSSNDAAEVLAEHYGREYFIEQMNNKAQAIGLRSTSYEDPSGLSKANISNAEDLFILAKHLYDNKTHILDVTKMDRYEESGRIWANNSRFLDYQGYLGGKSGFTNEAGRTQIALFRLPLAEFEDRDIAIVLLDTTDVESDVSAVLGFLEEGVTYNALAYEEDSSL